LTAASQEDHRFKGDVDWADSPKGKAGLLIGADGWVRLDVRAQVQIEDGAVVDAQYYGLLEMNDAVSGALQNLSATTFEQQ
jgi:hypothetical protein